MHISKIIKVGGLTCWPKQILSQISKETKLNQWAMKMFLHSDEVVESYWENLYNLHGNNSGHSWAWSENKMGR